MLSSIFMLVGFLLIVSAMALWGVPKFMGKKPVLKLVPAIFLILVGFLFTMSNGAVYYGEPGFNYLVQFPTGHQVGEVTPGYHLKWWGTAESFKKFITVKADSEQDTTVSASIAPIEGRFTDAVVANVDVIVRYQLPTNPEQFLKLALSYRTQDNLESSTLVPILREVVRNSARTMTAQDYIAGKGGEFENAILDQLRYGIYILDVSEIRPEGKIKIDDAEAERTIDQSQMVRYEVKFRYDDNGEILRKPTALTDYGILVSQANIADVDPEPKFKEMLAKQRDAAAEASVKKQEAKRAEYDKQKIIAEGETMKASIKIEQEKAQITKLIAAETAKKEAQIQLAEAKIQRLKAAEEAGKVKIAADAEAYRKAKLLQADGALQVKADIIKHISTVAAQAWAQRPVPQTVIGTTSDGTGGAQTAEEFNTFMNMMLVEQAKRLNLDMSMPRGAVSKK